MPEPETPDTDQPAELEEATTFLGVPVLRGATHHTQSLTPIVDRTKTVTPIKKRRTKNWWKRQPPD
jgi:hypothetical protein